MALHAQLTLSLLSLLAAVITVTQATAITVTQAITAITQRTTASAGAATIGLGGGIATTAVIMVAGTDADGAAVTGTDADGAVDTAGTAAAVIGIIDGQRRLISENKKARLTISGCRAHSFEAAFKQPAKALPRVRGKLADHGWRTLDSASYRNFGPVNHLWSLSIQA